MTREKLQEILYEFIDNSPLNFLGAANDVNTPEDNFGELKGMRFFDHPVFSIGRADDPGFKMIKQPEVAGEYHLLPQDMLPDAKTVISIVLPHTRSTVESNKKDSTTPSTEWVYTRTDGQQVLIATGVRVMDALIADGYKAVTPYTDKKYLVQGGTDIAPGKEHMPPLSSNWSERHVGYVTGAGTFGLSTNFISKVGSAVRLISVITDWDVEPDACDYDNWLGYCNQCGACVRKCPAQAHFTDRPGKDKLKCVAYLREHGRPHPPRLPSCGKCQTGTPCEFKPMNTK